MPGKGVHVRVRIRDRFCQTEMMIDADDRFSRAGTDQADTALKVEDTLFGKSAFADFDHVPLVGGDGVAGFGERAPRSACEAGVRIVAGQLHTIGGCAGVS